MDGYHGLEKLLQLAFSGNRIQTEQFAYVINYSSLAAAGTATGTFSVAGDSSFVLCGVDCTADLALAAQTESGEVLPLVTQQLLDTSSGKNLFDNAVPVAATCGSYQYKKPWYAPRLLPAKTTIQQTVVNYSTATTYNLRFTFYGVKVYNLGPA